MTRPSDAAREEAAPPTVDITELVERGRLTRGQVGVFLLIGACLVMDGFDLQAMGYVAPALIRDWNIPAPRLGPVFSAGLLGLFVGSLLFSMVADRIGRRPVLLGATLVYAVFTLLTASATSIGQLLVIRVLAGLGLGGMMPNATALVGEYSPRRRRITTMMVVTNGFMIGSMLGGFLASWLVPVLGWRSVFHVGGLVPLALLVPMHRWLPESLQFLTLRGRSPAAIARWARIIDPAVPVGDRVRYVVQEDRGKGLPLAELFRSGRAAGTGMLWAVNFSNVLVAYFVASWLPTVVRDAGYSTRTAVLVGTAVQAGGAIGTFVLGFVLQRRGFVAVLTACFGVAAATLAVLGQPGLPLALMVIVAFLAGWGIFGGQPGVNAMAATYYPTELRSTGIGAALAVGRFGAILGPLLASELMLRSWATRELFYAAAAPAAIAAAVVFATRWVIVPQTGPGPVARRRTPSIAG